jgi:hypothetical protein
MISASAFSAVLFIGLNGCRLPQKAFPILGLLYLSSREVRLALQEGRLFELPCTLEAGNPRAFAINT